MLGLWVTREIESLLRNLQSRGREQIKADNVQQFGFEECIGENSQSFLTG